MSRIEKLRTELSNRQLDAIVITDLYNLRYIANFTGTTGIAVVTKDDAVFITDFRYTKQAGEQAGSIGFTIRQNTQEIFLEVNDYLNEQHIKTAAIEANNMSTATYLRIKDLFTADIVPTTGVVETLRRVKDQDEIDTIKKACDITDQAYHYILTYIKVGMSEIQIANELERYLKTLGASGMSFDTIVASGQRSSMPHGVASEKLIEDGDVVTIDFGCYYNGYVSDMTRTFAVGSISPQLEEIYHIVLEAQLMVTANAKPGMTGKELDKIARDYIAEKGYDGYFGHGLGHGIGLEIHEAPGVSFRTDDILEPGMIITNEPGIYVDGVGGVRIEDDLIVTETGVEVINRSPKELIII